MFKVKDLLFNVVSNGSGVALVTPGTDISPLTPITPVIRVSRMTKQLQGLNFDKIDLPQFNELTNSVGRNFIAGICTQEMATCSNNEPISMVASFGDRFTVNDVFEMKNILAESLSKIQEFENTLELNTRKQASVIAPKLKDALECIS